MSVSVSASVSASVRVSVSVSVRVSVRVSVSVSVSVSVTCCRNIQQAGPRANRLSVERGRRLSKHMSTDHQSALSMSRLGPAEQNEVCVRVRVGECVDEWVSEWAGWLVNEWVGWLVGG